jgi:hypothetical protein
VLIAYAAYGLMRPTARLQLRRGALLATALVVGCITGALTAATGVFIVPMVMFLQMLDFQKEKMVQALGLSFTICTVALGMSLGWGASWNAWQASTAGWRSHAPSRAWAWASGCASGFLLPLSARSCLSSSASLVQPSSRRRYFDASTPDQPFKQLPCVRGELVMAAHADHQ